MVAWENQDIQTVTETWWDDSHTWSAQGMTINPSEGIMQERRGDGVTLDVFDCPELNDGNEKFVFKGKNQEEGQRGRVVLYRPPSQEKEADKAFNYRDDK